MPTVTAQENSRRCRMNQRFRIHWTQRRMPLVLFSFGTDSVA